MLSSDDTDYSNISVVIQGTLPPPRIPNNHKKKHQSHKQPYDQHYRHTSFFKASGKLFTKMQVTNGSLRAAATHSETSRDLKPKRQSRGGGGKPIMIWKFFRIILLDLPLALLFATLLSVYAIRNIYQDLYVPLMDRSTRTDADLDSEFTYYHRYCTEADITTRNIHDLVVDPKAPVTQGVQQMMEHGAVVIRDLLSQETVRKLRAYAVHRNTHIPEEEVYPVSQGRNRMSFGYDATENPIVVQALKELSNNRYLKQLLAEILGDPDPASSEITSITAYYNAPPQAWHSDTKEDGNALKYARTYSHSYSLFLPLQNTTKRMGMTDLCPGTHYCGNDLSTMCEMNKMSLADADPSGPHFKAGDGALLNQIVWHRGAAHRDPNSVERIVFIVSFLARPDMQRDPRQLSRGTYFHQKWNMWGHTWKDLMDPMRSMQKPFSYLRCLSLWKPPTHNWGYDLITSGFMRFSNEQLDDAAISTRLWPRLDQIHFPVWLRSDIPDEYELGQKQSWLYFLKGTIDRTLTFLREGFFISHALYLGYCVLGAIVHSLIIRRSPGEALEAVTAPIWRLSKSHFIAVICVFFTWSHVRNSQWGRAVLRGQALMRPFPEVTMSKSEELTLVSDGPTTFPANNDVLFGTRYDAKFLGMYEDYLYWHKGNKPYNRAIEANAPFYNSYKRLPSAFDARLLENVIGSVEKTKGRFLHQDYRTGGWRILSAGEIEENIRRDLSYAAVPVKAALRKTLRRMIALGRYAFGRETILMRKGVVYLHLLENRLTEKRVPVPAKAQSFKVELAIGRPHLNLLPKGDPKETHLPAHRRGPYSSDEREEEEQFPVGCTVYVEGYGRDEDGWDRGEVMSISKNGDFTLALESGFQRRGIPRSKIHKYNPTTEGDIVEGCFEEGMEDCYTGVVTSVAPDGSVSIEFEDGDFILRHPNFLFYTPPIEYIPPER